MTFSERDWVAVPTERLAPPTFAAAAAAAGEVLIPPRFADSERPDLAALALAALLDRAFSRRPTSSRLPLPYQRIPRPLRMLAAGLLGRWQRHRHTRWAAYPRWPIDLNADILLEMAGMSVPFRIGGRTPVWLSHDADSPAGLAALHDRFLSLEEEVGARSTTFVVPCAWPPDLARLDEMAARGHEIGIHGYDHNNLTPFAAPAERQRRLDAAQPLAERYGSVGYRAPSLLRTPALLGDLAGRYLYDSSIPTTGGLFPTPNSGCASARPFRLGEIWELPVTLPRDGSLRLLGHSPSEILALWRECAGRIADSGGMVSLLTHGESAYSGNDAMLETYRAFLSFLANDDRFVFTTTATLLAALEPTDSSAPCPALPRLPIPV